MSAFAQAFHVSCGCTTLAPFVNDETTRRRAWALLDWLVRYYGPMCFARVEHGWLAQQLAGLSEVTPAADLSRAATIWDRAGAAARAGQKRTNMIDVPATLWAVLELATTAAALYAPNPETAAQVDKLVSRVMCATHAALNGIAPADLPALFRVMEESARARLTALSELRA
jgi:hypothetical protein